MSRERPVTGRTTPPRGRAPRQGTSPAQPAGPRSASTRTRAPRPEAPPAQPAGPRPASARTRAPRPEAPPTRTRAPRPAAPSAQPRRATPSPQPGRAPEPARTGEQRRAAQPRRAEPSRRAVEPGRPVGIARLWSPRPGEPRRRQSIAFGLILVLLVVLAGRLVWVQGVAGPALAAESLSGRMTTVAIPADRGDIVDRNGVVLATSLERYNIVVNQRQLAQWKSDGSGPGRAAELLADLVGIPATELGPKLMGDRGFAYVAKGLVPEVTEEILALGIHGISSERTTERTDRKSVV